MTVHSFEIGQVYFRVTYPDVKMLYPSIESFVYLGMNFSDEDLEDTWYFQAALDFGRNGSALKGVERPVSCATVDELIDFESISQLTSTLRSAEKRRDLHK
jgi:hypothetical protein